MDLLEQEKMALNQQVEEFRQREAENLTKSGTLYDEIQKVSS